MNLGYLRGAVFGAVVLGMTPVSPPTAAAAPLCQKLGFAGLLAKCNRADLPPLTLAAGKPLAAGPLKLQSGAYYKLLINADGSAETALAGADFFRAVWVNEVVINGIELRPLGIDSLEFDDEGTAELSFVAIKPGRYTLGLPNARGDSQRVVVTIE